MNKTDLLDRYARDGDQRLLLARVLDQQQRAEQRGVPTHTGFLSPAEQAVSADLLMAAAPGRGILFGGYEGAERKLWAFLPDWLEEEVWRASEDCPVAALAVSVPPMASLTHRDYLGSLMGLGLTREKIGDILLVEGGAQVLVLRETLPILLAQWEKAGRYPVTLPAAGRRPGRRVLHPPEPSRGAHPGGPGDGGPPPRGKRGQDRGGGGGPHLPGAGQVRPHRRRGRQPPGPDRPGI